MTNFVPEDAMDIKFLDILRNYYCYDQNFDNSQQIIKAYLIAKQLHANVFRKSGDPYIIHPLEVSKIAVEYKVDCATICACLLHDVIEDTNYTLKELEAEFGYDVASIVDGVTKISKMQYNEEELVAKNTRKLFKAALLHDIRVIAVKLFDRLHNMRTLSYMSDEKQKSISIQTFQVFAPLAEAIGANAIKKELHDLCFYYLENDKYEDVKQQVSEESEKYKEELDLVINNLISKLNDENISNEIKLRIKNIYAVYNSFRKGRTIEDIHDLFALQINVNDIRNCYSTLGVIHQNYNHMDSKFKDYLKSPKTTGYRGLHTSIFSSNQNRLIQTQIRTNKMAVTNSKGIIANLKKYNKEELQKLKENYPFFSKAIEIDNTVKSDSEFYEKICVEVLGDKIYVISKSGTVYELPVGANLIDYAFLCCPTRAPYMVKGIINGEIIPLSKINTTLQNQQFVNFISQEEETIDPSWEQLAKTTRAKRLIRDYFNK